MSHVVTIQTQVRDPVVVSAAPGGEDDQDLRGDPGFAGAACQQATQTLEAALGVRQSETLTAEYHQPMVEEAGVVRQADGLH